MLAWVFVPMHIVHTSHLCLSVCVCWCGNFALCQVSLHPLCFHFCIKHGAPLNFPCRFFSCRLVLHAVITYKCLTPPDAHSFTPFAASSRCFLALHNPLPLFVKDLLKVITPLMQLSALLGCWTVSCCIHLFGFHFRCLHEKAK